MIAGVARERPLSPGRRNTSTADPFRTGPDAAPDTAAPGAVGQLMRW